MFILSKIVGWLINPETIALLLIVFAIAALLQSYKKLCLVLLFLSLGWICAVFYSPLSTMLMKPLEDRIGRHEIPKDIKGIIILGGGLESDISSSRNIVEFANGADRLVQAGILAAKFPDAEIIYTGGSGNVLTEGYPAADIAMRYLLSIGIQKERITLERKARNTFENVKFTKALVKPKKADKYAVVTSAFHMPRSIGLFNAQDWKVIPYPVDYRTSKRDGFGDPTRSPLDHFVNLRIASKEWIGLISYYLMGRTQEILPGHQLKNSG